LIYVTEPEFRSLAMGYLRRVIGMTYVVTDACIRCKYTDCVEVCPVDCFHEGNNMLVIDPEVCIDCGVCVPECPIKAIIPDTDPDASPWVELNQRLSQKWPVIRQKKPAPFDADEWKDKPNKLSFLEENLEN
jgi:ferredoxin